MLRIATVSGVVLFLLTAIASPAAAGDAFFKGGIVFHPRVTDLADRWFLSFGSDYPLNLSETAFLGFELQTALYREPLGNETAYLLPANGFFNAKYKAPTFGARPFAGGGIGMVSTLTVVGADTTWSRSTGIQLVGGIELGSVAVELRALRSLQTDAEFAYSLLFGFIW